MDPKFLKKCLCTGKRYLYIYFRKVILPIQNHVAHYFTCINTQKHTSISEKHFNYCYLNSVQLQEIE